MAFEKDFVKPEHPLPKEIQEMKRDETVCQFCGVSYLIHNEIKKLEDEITSLKNELKRYKGADEREEELKQKLQDESIKLKQSQENLRQEAMKNECLLEQVKELDVFKKQAEAARDSLNADLQRNVCQITALMDKNRMFESSLGHCQKELGYLKGEFSFLVNSTSKQREEIVDHTMQSSKIMDLIMKKYHGESRKFLVDNEELKNQLAGSQKILQDMEAKISKLMEKEQANKEVSTALEVKLKEIEALKTERRKLESNNDSLSDSVKKMTLDLSEMSHKLAELQSSLQISEESLKNAKNSEAKKLEAWRREEEMLSMKIKSLETEIENLKVSQKEENSAVASSSIQIKVLKECLEKSKTEVSLLKKEREDMIEAHQNRIKQLRESFNQKMLEADVWPKRLEQKLEEQQRMLNEEKNELWKELTTSFQKEMEDLKSAHEKEKRQIEEKEKSDAAKIKEQLETLQRRAREELDNVKTKLSREKENHDKICRSQEALIQNLELKIADLDRRLVGFQQKSVEDDVSYKQKYADTKRALDYLKEDFNRIMKELTNSKQEIDTLQETVRRECEERFELTEALSEARIQLLALQRRPSLTKLSNNIAVPHSPSSTNHDRNITKEKSLRNKRLDSMEKRIGSVSQDVNVPLDKVDTNKDDGRKRIAEAVAKQRASSRASFDRF